MLSLLENLITQSLPFFPLALAITISFHLMKTTDMTLDGSFVMGAGVFAKLVSTGHSPYLAVGAVLLTGLLIGMGVALIQRHRRVNALLAGILAAFMLTSLSLILMGKPNINLLTKPTLLSEVFAISEARGYLVVGALVLALGLITLLLLLSPFGLFLRAFGNNEALFTRYGFSTELTRCLGFSLTNMLASCSGCLTAQVVGYADVTMGLGMTLTGLGAILVGERLTRPFLRRSYFRVKSEFLMSLLGVLLYFALMNGLLLLGVDPLYLKTLLGLLLIFFLRSTRHDYL